MNYFFSACLYYLILYPISLLPFGVLYKIADGISWLFFNMVGYRKKVVIQNIRNSFPEKSESEIQQIVKEFYTHLATTLVETIKAFTMTKEDFQERLEYRNIEIINKYAEQGRSVILAAGHCYNYEWLVTGINASVKPQVMALYRPLNNAFFEKKIQESRGQLGLKLSSIYDIKSRFAEQISAEPVTVVFAMDQSPSDPKSGYWTTFLHQDTPVLFGTEKYAKQYDLPIIFGHLKGKKRGYYYADFQLLTDNPKETAYGEITEKMVKMLEADLQQNPAYWLWSHKRWKHKRPTDLSPLSAE